MAWNRWVSASLKFPQHPPSFLPSSLSLSFFSFPYLQPLFLLALFSLLFSNSSLLLSFPSFPFLSLFIPPSMPPPFPSSFLLTPLLPCIFPSSFHCLLSSLFAPSLPSSSCLFLLPSVLPFHSFLSFLTPPPAHPLFFNPFGFFSHILFLR